ncbi:MAG: nucleotidyl transferase AbiEii/AbiGii toxin family protein [Bacteriovoracaceae bacterium]|nr:nucleotidyl transferase AbiEii/AbiGii toxin family protein [Bacteriovoracaceae bacterium]
MRPVDKYKSAQNFRSAVQEKLKLISRKEGIDIMRLYRQVGYTHFLARLFKDRNVPWVLKGGHALELRLQESRATKDIDLALKETKFLDRNEKERIEAIKETLIEKGRIDLGDFFEFLVTGPKMELDAAPYGGARFQVEALIDGKRFTIFDLDIGIGDVWIEPHNELVLKNHLDFAGFEASKIQVINVEQHFAEKIHAYTVPRDSENSRVKDLVDLYLIAKNEKLDSELLKQCLQDTFKRRDTHSIPFTLQTPPERWLKPFNNFELGIEMDECFKFVSTFWDELERDVTRGGI